jgi:hypothetical protein
MALAGQTRPGWGSALVLEDVATALRPETRRSREQSLLASYRRGLLTAGVPAPVPDVLARRYRAHLVYPFEAMVVTLAVGGMMDLAANLELIRRTGIAAADHRAFSPGPCDRRP